MYASHNDSNVISLMENYDRMIVFVSNEQMKKTFLEISLKEYRQDASIYEILGVDT